LIQIVSNGGSLDLQIGGLTTPQLVQLVSSARKTSTIILRGAKTRTTPELVQISASAAGMVVLDVG
jgi:hypothetical protein